MLVSFFWSKKGIDFNYSPKPRFLSNISKKELIVSEDVCDYLLKNNLDEALISEIIKNGKIDFWNKKRVDDCIEYRITGASAFKIMKLILRNCDASVLVMSIQKK